MRKLFALVVLVIVVVAARPPSGGGPTYPWTLYKWNNNYVASGNGTNWSYPVWSKKVAFPAFVTTTTIPELLGDLTGGTLSATVTTTVTSGSPILIPGGYMAGWNTEMPSKVRFFFAITPSPYDLSDAVICPPCYWFSNGSEAEISANAGTVNLSVNLNPIYWSDAQGHQAADPMYTSLFLEAVENVEQIGLALANDHFFDTGIGIKPASATNSTGTATFTLNSFTLQ